jgi:hypothetical protein
MATYFHIDMDAIQSKFGRGAIRRARLSPDGEGASEEE